MKASGHLYDVRRETLSPLPLAALQLKKLRQTVLFCAKKSAFYKHRKKISNKDAHLKSLNDFAQLPFTTKHDLLTIEPRENLCVPDREIAEVHFSSGTSGKSTPSYMSYKDIVVSSKYLARTWYMQGLRKESAFAMCASYGLFSGGFINHYAIQNIGSFIIPIGNASAPKTLDIMSFFSADACAAVASYYPYLIAMAEANGFDLATLKLKNMIAGGEPFSEEQRLYIEKKFNARLYNQYGLCEINTGLAGECSERKGMHILADYVYPEIVEPETGDVLKDDQEGELVLTTFHREASPLIRYRTGDITSISHFPCHCGRTMPRISNINRRVTETIFFKGLKIEKQHIDEMFQNLSDHINPYLWQMQIDTKSGRDKILFKIAQKKRGKIVLNNVSAYIHKHLGLKTDVAVFTSEELSSLGSGKLKHFVDNRPRS